jgi:hypothetical protein
MPVLRQNLIQMPNASPWSHITPVNIVISGFLKLLKLKADEVLAKDSESKGIAPPTRPQKNSHEISFEFPKDSACG